ncbi:MAG: trypsin-like peptidase domain-containing protein [Treponema sp.]|jgi:S1-C subfamily serine protease|nr:trypsin-like peptidase domain-containing protein [Treponema sp.]
MKLYSRRQVVFFSILSIIGVFAVIMILVGLNVFDVSFSSAETRFEEAVLSTKEQPVLPAAPVNTLSSYTEDERENISVYERLNSAVVNITTETVSLNWFLEAVPQDGGSGSGSIIDVRKDGVYVLTNYHVIEKANKVFINLADGSQFNGVVVGVDPENDIAVLKFTPTDGAELHTIPFGESDNIKVGQKVLAIGNPFALERTLTVGIVSGLGRPIKTANQHVIRGMIQTDASINPGNSGGPLLDTRGRMIGINTMIYSPSGGSVGIGFAIPVNTAKRVVAELIAYGKVRRGWLDVSVVQLFPNLVSYARLPVSKGLLVSRVRKNGLAEQSGIREGTDPVRYGSSIIYLGGDLITNVDGVDVPTLADLYAALEDNKPGEKVQVQIMRGNKSMNLTVTLADREEVIRQ